MSRSSFFSFSLLAVLMLVGAGCFGRGEIDASTDGGVWKSLDAGETWVQSVAVPTPAGVNSASGTNVLTLAHDPSDHLALYAGLERDGLLFSYDGAAGWQGSGDAAVSSGAVTAVAVDPAEKCRVYVARAERIFRSEDCNRSYEDEIYIETKPGVIVTAITIDWFTPSQVYAAFSDGTILKSSDRGAKWTSVFRGRQAVTSLLVSRADSRVLLAGMAGAGMARSVDGGETWEVVLDPLRPYRDANRVIALAQDGQGSVIYVATYYGLLRSVDQGVSWEPLNLLSAPNQVMIGDLATDPANPNVILYSVGGSLYKSVDAGANWSVQKLPTLRFISAILFDRTNSNVVYVGLRKIE